MKQIVPGRRDVWVLTWVRSLKETFVELWKRILPGITRNEVRDLEAQGRGPVHDHLRGRSFVITAEHCEWWSQEHVPAGFA